MTLKLSPSVAHAVAVSSVDVDGLRLAVNRTLRNASKRWGGEAAFDTVKEALNGLAKRLKTDAGTRAVACPVYGAAVVSAMNDVRSRIAWLEEGVAVTASGLRGMATVVDRARAAIDAGSADHGPTLAPDDAPMESRLLAMHARIAWLDDKIEAAYNDEEQGEHGWFERERDGLMATLAFYGSEHLRSHGLRSDGQRRAADRIPGLDY